MSHRIRVLVALILATAVLAGCSRGKDKDKDNAANGAGSTTSSTDTTVPEAKAPAVLTGLDAPVSKNARPLLIVKVDNDPAGRPQAGLAEADVVFEQMVEGGVTRFAALYQSTDAAAVGPVRSARSTDVNLATSFNRPLFAYSGANSVFRVLLRKAVFIDVGVDVRRAAYTPRPDRTAPSNLFTSTEALFKDPPANGSVPTALWPFRPAGQPSAVGTAATAVDVVFPGKAGNKVRWTWDAATSSWLRDQAGTPHVDADGKRLGAPNVVVQFVGYKDSTIRDRSGAAVPEAVLVGSGDAWIMTDGKLVKGKWEKPSITKPTVFTDGKGQPVPLTPGRTWIELTPPGSGTIR
jgi:hypothetical protein